MGLRRRWYALRTDGVGVGNRPVYHGDHGISAPASSCAGSRSQQRWGLRTRAQRSAGIAVDRSGGGNRDQDSSLDESLGECLGWSISDTFA